MDINTLKNEIAVTARALEEQITRITELEGNIPQIDIDIAMGNIRKIYEDFYTLDKINRKERKITRDKKPTPKKDMKSSLKKEQVVEFDHKTERDKEKTSTTEKKPHIKPEPEKTDISDSKSAEPKREEKKAEPKNKTQKKSDKKRTIDLYSDTPATLGDKLMDEQDESLAAKMQKNKIHDLKTAIGINEKFLFINELFDSNVHEYNQAIDQLNSFDDYDKAFKFINELKDKYGWKNDDTYKYFLSFIKRRY